MKSTALPAPTKDLDRALLGIWKLRTREDMDSSGKARVDPVLGADPLGIVCFAPGYFAAQFMKRDRSSTQRTPDFAPGKNNSGGVDGYDAYFGTYVLDRDAGKLVTELEGSISRSNIGSKFVRDVRVLDNELIIQLETTAPDGTPVTRRLCFTRLH
jgi:Lipocalin-like domain